jgi:hypothetical protein
LETAQLSGEAPTATLLPPEKPNDFELVEGALPLARLLDSFANTAFEQTGYTTRQEIASYLEAGAEAFQEGVQFVRRHGLTPAEFPPIQRMLNNLQEAQEASQTIADGEAKLRRSFDECSAEIYRLRIRASLEENDLVLTEISDQIQDLECTQTDILALLEEQHGGLHPSAGPPSAALTSNRDPWHLRPDS